MLRVVRGMLKASLIFDRLPCKGSLRRGCRSIFLALCYAQKPDKFSLVSGKRYLCPCEIPHRYYCYFSFFVFFFFIFHCFTHLLAITRLHPLIPAAAGYVLSQ